MNYSHNFYYCQTFSLKTYEKKYNSLKTYENFSKLPKNLWKTKINSLKTYELFLSEQLIF